ncbi:hypothetical protein [Streptomyces sp. NPDC056600]|uniref:hypothetical protein n=1 Tax=Streptomyces sp. NPDC056600 TaxID=3345874 RepID=UPI003690FC75
MSRRLLSLCAGELVNVPLQAVIWFGVARLPATWPNVCGFALCALILLQGAAYWAAKLRSLSSGSGARPPGIAFLAAARMVDVPLLGLGLVLTAGAVIRSPGPESVPGLFFACFAVLEYVNYFHIQLVNAATAGGPGRRGCRAHLARDLERLASQGKRDGPGTERKTPTRA